MEINVDEYGTVVPAAGTSTRLQAEARQSRWLFEVEHAMLQQTAKKPSAQPSNGAKARHAMALDADRQPLRERAMEQERSADQRADGGPLVVLGTFGAPPRDIATSPNNIVGASRGDASAPARYEGTQASTDSMTHIAAAPMLAASDGTAVIRAVMAEPAVPSLLSAHQLYGTIGATVQLGLSSSGALAGETALTVQKITAPAPGWNLASSAPAARQTGIEEMEPVAMSPCRGQEVVNGEEYAARLLHVYSDADGVQAWLRDAGIGTAQASLLAQTMAAELGGAGSLLTALTVNGQRLPLFTGTQLAQWDHDEETGDSLAPQDGAQLLQLKTNANGAT